MPADLIGRFILAGRSTLPWPGQEALTVLTCGLLSRLHASVNRFYSSYDSELGCDILSQLSLRYFPRVNTTPLHTGVRGT